MVATDRVSAFDQKLGIEIPDKGKILNAISAEFACLAEDEWGFCTAYSYADVPDVPYHRSVNLCLLDEFDGAKIIGNAQELSERFTFMSNLRMFPVECIVRGYLFGSLWELYKQGEREMCGVRLPDGLVKGSKLPEPIFTPTTKAPEGEHDKNITLEEMASIIKEADMVTVANTNHGTIDYLSTAITIRDLCLNLYKKASEYAYERGLIIADTKFELGLTTYKYKDCIYFGDEILTPDSSRFWDAAAWAPGEEPKSYDKQIIRDYLAKAKARGEENLSLPAEIIEKTRQRYIELYEKLTGKFWPRE